MDIKTTKTLSLIAIALLLVLSACSGGGSGTVAATADAGGVPPPPPPPPPADSREVNADFHSLKTAPLAAGQFELITLSTLPDAVTGGDVLVGIRGLAPTASFTVTRNGVDVSSVFSRTTSGLYKDNVVGLVTGLTVGDETLNTLVASSGGKSATLVVKNHPISGPVSSGPYQRPFVCQTKDAGLGDPLDADCSIATTYQWFYRSQQDQAFHALADPYAAYPSDVMPTQTSDGRGVPFVVRVESSTINRGIARIAVLDDPAKRGKGKPFDGANWNHRVFQVFGESCGVGFRQGVNTPAYVLGGIPSGIAADSALINFAGGTERLSKGDIVMHSTLAAFGNHCNQLISAETSMMVKEHIIEQYGPIEFMVGTNGSGAALQQYNAINNAPGLLNAALPTATFADIITTAMTVTDCGQLIHYYNTSALNWTDQKRAAVDGHLPGVRDTTGVGAQAGVSDTSICASWNSTFFGKVKPDNCPGGIPANTLYNKTTNPTGLRCSIPEGNINLLGRDPVTGFARQPIDNVGIQYGLKAFNAGTISFDEFLDLNTKIGGLDVDGAFVPVRHSMSPDLAQFLYHVGGIIGRGAIAETPVMDIAPYLDLIPLLNIHEAVRPFVIRARLHKLSGSDDVTHAIWRGVATQPDAYPVMEQWLKALQQKETTLPANDSVQRIAAIKSSKPSEAQDSCVVGTIGGGFDFPVGLQGPLGFFAVPIAPGQALPNNSVPLRAAIPENFDTNTGPCQTALRVTTTPRMVAGMPLTDDVIKCQLKPVSPSDYTATLTAAQLDQLRTIFPTGVCDYTKPGVGDDGKPSLLWPSFGGVAPLVDANSMPAPVELKWRVARSP